MAEFREGRDPKRDMFPSGFSLPAFFVPRATRTASRRVRCGFRRRSDRPRCRGGNVAPARSGTGRPAEPAASAAGSEPGPASRSPSEMSGFGTGLRDRFVMLKFLGISRKPLYPKTSPVFSRVLCDAGRVVLECRVTFPPKWNKDRNWERGGTVGMEKNIFG